MSVVNGSAGNDYLESVQLFTEGGDLVATVVVPRNVKQYDVLQWGSRVFYLKNGRYVEGCCWVVQP